MRDLEASRSRLADFSADLAELLGDKAKNSPKGRADTAEAAARAELDEVHLERGERGRWPLLEELEEMIDEGVGRHTAALAALGEQASEIAA